MALNVRLATVFSGKMDPIYKCVACFLSVEIATFSIAQTISALLANLRGTYHFI
jgi:hypothetical protein